MRLRTSRVLFATAYLVFVLGLFVALGGLAYAQGPQSSASDQYGSQVKGVEVSQQQPAAEVASDESALPNTGLSLLGTVVVGGALVALGLALRRRERSKNE